MAAIDDHVQHVTEIPNEEVDATEEGEMNPNSNTEDIEEMNKRLKEKEDEDRALLEMQAKVGKGMSEDAAGASSAALTEKEEADSRSIYVGNVDYACTPEEVQKHFQSCGTVNRVTILTDKLGLPKGYAYVEFVEIDAVQNALLLNESELHGRQLKVSAKRTNVPGMKQHRARRPNLYMAYQSPFLPPSFYSSPYGYGKAPRYRRPMRFGPYN